jgi:hypothetical protein
MKMGLASKSPRISAFREVGLLDEAPSSPAAKYCQLEHTPRARHCSLPPSIEDIQEEDEDDELSIDGIGCERNSFKDTAMDRVFSARPSARLLSKASLLLGLIVIWLHCLPKLNLLVGRGLPFVEGHEMAAPGRMIRRANSPTDICKRWSQQSAVVKGTLYLYGGRATTSATQTSNTWNNNFLTLDLTKSWQIASPPVNGLPQPSGPPAVANGYLWHSNNSLYLYGGEYSDTPPATPAPYSLWEYNIGSSSWIQHSNPKTSDGLNSEPGGTAIQGVGEGAGFSVPQLGMGWYFGGHIDAFTTPGWSVQVPRQYLKSFIEFTFPGFGNAGVTGLNGQAAGSDGAWRNITQAGIQGQAGFTERADGLLLYIPGFGPSGILISLAGGTNDTFTQMNQVDVYDIANSTWYRQATSGPSPNIRVNPCAVVAAAAE